MSETVLLGTTGKLTTAELEAILVTKKRNKDQAEALLINTGLITSETAEATATNVVTAAKLKELVQTKALTQAEADLIAAKAGVTLANQKESVSLLAGVGAKIKGAGTALKGLGTGILTIASAHPVIAGITAAIALCGGAAIVNKVKQEKAAKAIKEAYENAKTAIDDINNTFNENSSKTKEIAKEYAELAQGVNLLTNENKKLSTEKYERFLDLSNQLSSLYPSLTKQYDENGNAILDLSGSVDTIVGSLDDLIERQRTLANQEIVEQMPDLFKGYTNNVTDYEDKLKDAENTKEAIQSAYDEISKYGIYTAFDINGNATDENGDPVALKLGQYIDLLKKLGITAKQVNLKDSIGRIIGYKLELEDGSDIPNLSGIHDAYVSAFNQAQEDVKYAQQQLDAERTSINQYLNTWLQTEFSYNQIEDNGMQKAIQEMLFNFDWNSLPEGIDKNDWNAVSEYLRRNILFAINNVQDNPEISSAISEVFTNAELTPDEKANYLQQIQDFFGEDSSIVISLKPQIEETNTLQKQLNASVDKFKSEPIDITPYQEALDDEYQKIQDWGLEDYADKIKNGTIQSVFGNVDMDKRTIITWSDELKQTYADALSSWDYDPEVGSIDTVFGGSNRFGEELNGVGWEVAFTPILPDGTFLSQDAVYDYINTILEEAYANDGKVTEDELVAIDAQGRQIGNTFVHGIFAGIDDSQNYDNNGNWAETVGRLMHFSGDFGAVQIAKDAITKAKKQESDFDWDSWFKENSINTQEEIDRWNEIAESATNAADARKKYTEGEEGNKTDISSFKDAWKDLDSKVKDKLLELAKAGKLTNDTFKKTEGISKFIEQLKALGITAEEAIQKINKKVDSSDQLSAMSSQISKMSDMLADKKNGVTADVSDLAGFDVTVKGLDSWNEFERVMGSSKSSMEECQAAANALATEWVNSNNFLANLDETNKDYYITQLKDMGIKNANEIVTAALAQKEKELAAQTEYETIATEYNSDAKDRNNQITTDLTNATIDEIAEIIAEDKATADTEQVMAAFALSKIDVNNAKIDTSSDIEQIVAIANAAGASAEYVDALRVALNNLQKAEQGKKQVSELPLAGISAQIANASAEANVQSAEDAVESALNDIKKQIKENQLDVSDYIINPSGSGSYKGSSKSSSSGSGSNSKQAIDWIERKITILNNKIDAFATKASDTWSSWTSRTKALNSEMETTKKLLTSVYGISSKTQKKLNSQRDSAKNKLDKYVKKNSKVLTSSTIKKINSGKLDTSKLSKKDKKVIEEYKKLQKDYNKKASKAKKASEKNPAADYYFAKANKVAKKYKLSPAIIKKIKNGTINISDYNESMANAIQKYQDYYDKGKDAQKSKKEAKQKLNELAQQNFELIQSKWDARIGYQENRKNAVSDALNLAQSKGKLIGTAYYTKQKGINNKDINKYKQEETELKKAMKGVKKYSKQWYEYKADLSEVHSKYVQLQADNAELQNSINELKFDRFDELINKFDDIIDESDFLIDLLDSDNLFNSDNGSITNDGITAMGLTAQNYDVYLAEAEQYKKQIADLEQMYKNGEIGISDYNSKMRELQGGYRDSIKSANDAKKAVIDYVKQGLDAQNEALSKSIDKQKELLESEKDLHDFQSKISDQNKNIANLRKQIAALEGDDSESNRKRLQQLKSDLQDAEKEQADTLYDRSVSDQEKALDDMLTKSQDAAEAYLKDSEKVFIDALNYVNANTSQVSQNLEKIAKDTGYDISTYITNAWKDSGDAVGTYESTLSSNVPKITAQIKLITNAWQAQCEAAEKAAKASAKAAAGTDETTKDTDKKGNSSNGSGNKSKTSSAKDIKKYITDHADKAKQKKSYYGVLNQYIYDKTGGKVLSVKEEVELAKMLGVSVKSDLSGSGDRKKIYDALLKKKIAFANGGILGDLVKLTGEDGLFIGSAGESILTKEQTQALIDFRPAIPQFGNMMDILKNVSVNSRVQSPTYQIDNRTIVEGVATDKIVKEMEGVAQRQAENVVRKINSATYAKGVRR